MWWWNCSGTNQPAAAFRAKADLPEEKFVPWQKLKIDGLAQQRATFSERRAAAAPRVPDPCRAPRASGAGTERSRGSRSETEGIME